MAEVDGRARSSRCHHIAWSSDSMVWTQSISEKGQPCQMSLHAGNGAHTAPLTSKKLEMSWYKSKMVKMKRSPK